MTKTFRMLMLTGALAGAFAVSTGAAAKEITVALASTFTTMDPYDAGDTLSQNSAKSMYEGLFGLDKDMKLKNALATGYEKSSELVDELVKKGEITVEQGKALNTELKRKVSETVDDAKKAAAEAGDKAAAAADTSAADKPADEGKAE